MAKRWKEDDDDLDLDLEFDRVEYMKNEINKGKSTIIAVAVAPLFALVSMYVFTLTMEWVISLLAGLLGIIFLKPIYERTDIDIDKLGKKGWAKNGGVYLLTLLAVWVILMNPPISDFADPQFQEVEIEIYDPEQEDPEQEEWVSQDEANITAGESYRIRVVAEITDNVAVDEDTVEIEFDTREGSMDKFDDHMYEFSPEDLTFDAETEEGEESYDVYITVEDVNGNTNDFDDTLTIEW